MSINTGLFETPSAVPKANREQTPARILVTLVVLIFLSEIVAMTIIYYLELPSFLVETVIDALIMTVLILPCLYFLHLSPLSRQINERKRAEQFLQDSEELLRTVLELLPVGVWITDKSGKIVHGNPASREIWAGARYVGLEQYGEYKGWWVDTGEPIQPDEWAAARAVIRGETLLNEEVEIECFDGSHKVILNSATPIKINDFIRGVIIVNQDITERKHAEQELQRSEALFKSAFQILPVGAWITDEGGNIIFGNDAGQEIWAGAKYVGIEQFGEYKGWWLSSGEPIAVDDWAVARAVKNGETSLNEEIEIECFDGTHKIILNSAIPVQDEQGHTHGVFVVNEDITQRKQAEENLIHSKELIQKAFNSIDLLIAYLDRNFTFIQVNEAYALSAGHPLEFFTGKNHFELYPNPENEAIFRRVVETGEPYSVLQKPFEYSEYPERGVTYWDWSVQPVKGADGKIQGVVLSLVDVTERKSAEYQIARQNQDLIELSQAEHRQRELAESLVQSTIAVNSSLQLETVLGAILEQIHRAIPFNLAYIALIENMHVRVVDYLAQDVPAQTVEAMHQTYPLDDFPLWLKAYNTQQPVSIQDIRDPSDWGTIPGWEQANSYAGAPLIAAGQVIGFINVTSNQPCYFNEQIIAQLTAFAVPAALAIQNARLYMAEKDARQVAETLSDSASALAQTMDQDQALRSVLEQINRAITPDVSGIGLLDENYSLVVRAANGFALWNGPDYTFPILEGTEPYALLHECMTTGKPQLVADTGGEPLEIGLPGVDNMRSWLLVPVVAHEKTIGLVGLGKTVPGYFTSLHVQLVEALASQAAVSIQNAWLFQQVRSSSERLQSLARKLVEVQENERYHIARELHDDAGQALSVLKLGLGRLEQDPACPQQVREKLEELKGVADCVLEDLHRLAVDLRPIVLDHLGLVPALEQYAQNLASDSLSVQFKALGFDGDRLPKDLESCLYRIVQEALTNVIRHAHAGNVGVLLKRRSGNVKLFVEDDGAGFNPNSGEIGDRLGLVGMRERAEMFGGTLTIESTPGSGTSIIVEVPVGNSHSHR